MCKGKEHATNLNLARASDAWDNMGEFCVLRYSKIFFLF